MKNTGTLDSYVVAISEYDEELANVSLKLDIKVRLGYCFTPYQQLWLYNGAPLVAFHDTLGIRRTYSRLKPPASSRGRLG